MSLSRHLSALPTSTVLTRLLQELTDHRTFFATLSRLEAAVRLRRRVRFLVGVGNLAKVPSDPTSVDEYAFSLSAAKLDCDERCSICAGPGFLLTG